MSQDLAEVTHELNSLYVARASPTTISNMQVATESIYGEQSLPAHDRGKEAWRVLMAAFIFESLLWGFPLSFGVFQSYYAQQPEFQDSPYISVVGTVASGIVYTSTPIMVPLTQRYSRYRRHMILVGWPLCLLALVAGSFATNLGSLIFTQGVMYGVGFIIFYCPILSMVNEFWIERRGMAYGLLCSASGLSGAAFPFVIEELLRRYGYHTTLRAMAVGLLILTAPFVPLLKGRLPASVASTNAPIDWSFLRSPLFWMYSVSNFGMSLGYFFPSLYLPSYAASNGLSSRTGALLLAMMSCSQVLGQLSFGYLSDKRQMIDWLAVACTAVAAVAAYACWNLAHTFQLLAVFAVFYGFFGAGYTALWGRMASKISSQPSAEFMTFALLNFGKGLGNISAGPIGGALLSSSVVSDMMQHYDRIILFTGTSMAVSGATIVAWHLWSSIPR